MSVLRGRETAVPLLFILQLSEAAQFISIIARAGDKVTLPSGHLTNQRNICEWIRTGRNSADLVKQGRIVPSSLVDPHRFSLAADCSLVIQTVTTEDAGDYQCRLTSSAEEDTVVPLSVVQITEADEAEWVKLTCSVFVHGWCRHKVRWLYTVGDEDGGRADIKSSSITDCGVTVTFPVSFKQRSALSELFKCEVTDGFDQRKLLLELSPRSSAEEPGQDAVTASTTESVSTIARGRRDSSQSAQPTTGGDPALQQKPGWWWYIIAAVGLLTLVISIVVLLRWKKTKGKKTKMADTTRRSLNQAVTPQSAAQISDDVVEPEDGVLYTSVSYSRRPGGEAQVKDDGDEGEAVTYSTLRVPSSADRSSIYATVNETKR